MRRTILAILTVSVVVGGAASAWGIVYDQAGPEQCNVDRPTPFNRLKSYVKSGYHRNVDWPYPYICPDREAVRQPFAIMVHNGWRKQNLLGAHHFNADGNGLSTAGELKVYWIATQAPAEFRNIYVERAVEPAITADRVAAARAYATQVTLDGQPPEVLETNIIYEGRPASVVDAVNVRFQESAPPPVLPPSTYTNTGQ
jgi:hypothetical protein